MHTIDIHGLLVDIEDEPIFGEPVKVKRRPIIMHGHESGPTETVKERPVIGVTYVATVRDNPASTARASNVHEAALAAIELHGVPHHERPAPPDNVPRPDGAEATREAP